MYTQASSSGRAVTSRMRTGRDDHRYIEHARIRQAPADARRLRALEQEAVAVAQKLPRQAEQERGGFAGGLDFVIGRAGFEQRIHVDGETVTGITFHPPPTPA